jgi:hypothetical protein
MAAAARSLFSLWFRWGRELCLIMKSQGDERNRKKSWEVNCRRRRRARKNDKLTLNSVSVLHTRESQLEAALSTKKLLRIQFLMFSPRKTWKAKKRAQRRDNEKHDDKLILKICDINQMNFLGKKTFFVSFCSPRKSASSSLWRRALNSSGRKNKLTN